MKLNMKLYELNKSYLFVNVCHAERLCKSTTCLKKHVLGPWSTFDWIHRIIMLYLNKQLCQSTTVCNNWCMVCLGYLRWPSSDTLLDHWPSCHCERCIQHKDHSLLHFNKLINPLAIIDWEHYCCYEGLLFLRFYNWNKLVKTLIKCCFILISSWLNKLD